MGSISLNQSHKMQRTIFDRFSVRQPVFSWSRDFLSVKLNCSHQPVSDTHFHEVCYSITPLT